MARDPGTLSEIDPEIAPPVLTSQTAAASEQGDGPLSLAEALLWDYRFVFLQRAGSAGDDVEIAFEFNALNGDPHVPGQRHLIGVSETAFETTNPDGDAIEAFRIATTGILSAGEMTVSVEGWTTRREDTDEGTIFTYVDDHGRHLSVDEARSIGARTVTVSGLNCLSIQTVGVTCCIMTASGRRSAAARFPAPVQPLIEIDTPIDVAAIPTGHPVARPLADQLGGLFDGLFAAASGDGLQVRLSAAHRYVVAAREIRLPILLSQPINVARSDAEADTSRISQTELAETTSEAVLLWRTQNRPTPGELVCDLTVFATESSGPLLRLSQLVLGHWTD